ncbi:flagellar basal-body MS-ring/collar protein FliF [Alkalicoccus daliensis]|uniref:Flagellar M-ring protein n=1 Tax=Alkalicoccus daliensis TaxID=745820 RepID=A0A1H0A4P2_9BACI|nr:flagellar basal-body MS-ring/collar protein FliF [Alkalicoccus daliensis]SDN27913.1 flagellar M-ring protein FliF [Alkalicoccus daliensis]
MKDQITNFKNSSMNFWQSRSKNQKGLIFGAFTFALLLIITFSWLGSQTHYVPLYTNMTMQEAGEVKETLDARGIANQVSADGTTISVPENAVDDLKVSLAAEGIPQTGRIDYSTFSENLGFGTTENEFQLLERAAIQTSLEDLIRNIDGISNAQVMITLPEESPWLAEEQDAATASVMVNIQPGASLDENQVRSLYHLVAQSVPNLTTENIVITDQMSRYLEFEDSNSIGGTLSAYEQNRAIQKDIEKDIQRDLQQMLGTMMGQNKVVVAVSTDIDFTQENRQEELVEPVDEETNEGIAVSVERITETYEGMDMEEFGVPGAGEDDIPNFPGMLGGGAYGDSERIEERINNEVNRISRDIVESPYLIRDIGIQVMVEPPDPEDEASLPQARLDDIQAIIGQVVRTSIDGEITAEWGEEEIAERIYVSSLPFMGQVEMEEPPSGIPFWYYIVGALVLVVGFLIFLLVRKGKESEEEEFALEEQTQIELPSLNDTPDSEEKARKRQLEELAKDKPDQFSKLIRTWLSED